jgi:hypothetical protein
VRAGSCRRLALVVAAVALGCGAGVRPPAVAERVPGEVARIVREPRARLWPRLLAALAAEGFEIADADAAAATVSTRPVPDPEGHVTARLRDVAAIRAADLPRVERLDVAHHLVLRPAPEGGATRLVVRSTLLAIERRDVPPLPPGLLPLPARRVPVASRGVVERELVRRVGGAIFAAEEMLLVLGEPGVD